MSTALQNIERFYKMVPWGIIQVGASKGQEVPEYKESGIRPVVLVEPLDDSFRRLCKVINGEPGFFPVQKCLSDTAGKTVTFNVASNWQSSSYYEPKDHLTLYPRVTFDNKIELVTDTLDGMIAALAGDLDPTLLDYISLDTQGAELDILKGGPNCLGIAKFVYTEVSFKGLYAGAPDIYDMIAFMREANFDLFGAHMTSKSWGDALFIKKGVVS
jgi:FkbM family methyltransferase